MEKRNSSHICILIRKAIALPEVSEFMERAHLASLESEIDFRVFWSAVATIATCYKLDFLKRKIFFFLSLKVGKKIPQTHQFWFLDRNFFMA